LSLRVFLVDDHEVVRSGLRGLLEMEPDIEVVGEAGTAEEALARIPPTRPDVAVLDVRLPDGNGIEVCREVLSRVAGLKCLVLTSYADDEALLAAVMAGASGYLLKQIRNTELLASVRRAGKGESLLDQRVIDRVMRRLESGSVEDARLSSLTHQERRILHRIAQGETNREIAVSMHLAEKTVKNYVSNLLSKLGMQRRTEAAVFATRLEQERDRSRRGDSARW
jgi:two-component system response regulator DevR